MTAEPEPQPTNESWINPPNESWIKRHMALSTVIAVILLSILAGVVQAILEDYGETTVPARTTDLSGNIDKSDIELRIKTLRKECSGSGCDVTYRVVVDGANKDDWPKTGDVYVSFTVAGPEDGPEDGNAWIWLEDESYEEPWEQVTSTRSGSVELTVKVTDVAYSA
jgi:hypothetical protein